MSLMALIPVFSSKWKLNPRFNGLKTEYFLQELLVGGAVFFMLYHIRSYLMFSFLIISSVNIDPSTRLVTIVVSFTPCDL